MKIKHYILTFLMLCAAFAFGQDARFTASVSKSQVGTGEQFEVVFTLKASAERFVPPDFNGFQVLSGPNQSSSWSDDNGVVTSSMTLSYILAAPHEGTFTIGSASVVVGGKTLSTRPLQVKVVKGQPQRQNSAQGQQSQGADDVTDEAPTGDIKKSLFIRADVDKTHVYQGEQLTITYKLYTRLQLLGSEMNSMSDFNGFWNQDIGNAINNNQGVQWHIETLNGQRYNVAELKKTLLYPEHSGDIGIDPMVMTFGARVPVRSRDPFEQMFGGGSKDENVKVKSDKVVIHVKPLPDAGKPPGFSGGVGHYIIESSVDKRELKANEAINYKIKITGSGNIKLLDAPALNFPPDFEKYDPKVADTVKATATGAAGSRIFTYLLIPRHQGNYNIEPARFSYFDPQTGHYVSLSTKAFDIKVNKGDGTGNLTAVTPADKQDVKTLNNDIRYIKTTGTDLHRGDDEFYGSAGYWCLILAGPLLFILALVYRRWDEQNNSDIVKVKSRKAGKIAAKHLANAEKQLQARNTKVFYEDISKGLYGYLSNKLNISIANLDKETIANSLRQRKASEELISRLTDTLDLCEIARFAPVSGVAEQDVFNKAKTLINDIETQL